LRKLTISQEAARMLLMNLRAPGQSGHTYQQLESLRAIRGAIYEAAPEYMRAMTEKADEFNERRKELTRANDQHGLAVLTIEDGEWADNLAVTDGAEKIDLILGNEDFAWAQEHIKSKGGYSADDDTLELIAEIGQSFEQAVRVKVVDGKVVDDEPQPRETTPIHLNRRARRAAKSKRG
jgi:hypothetical protein